MPKVQLLRFLNLADAPEVLPPGDLRLWKALSQALPEVKFFSFRVVGIEWADSVDPSRLPEIGFWNEAMGASGTSTLALSSDCDLPCLQRRRQGAQSSELETLIEEHLRDSGFSGGFEVWEAVHFEMQTESDIGTLEENVNKLLSLESRSGLFDRDSEELRFVRPGDSWSWSRHEGLAAGDAGLDDLLSRLKSVGMGSSDYDPLRRSYTIREQQPRGPAQTRQESPFLERLEKLQRRGENTRLNHGEDFLPVGVVSSMVSFHRYSDPLAVIKEIDSVFRGLTRFADDDLGVVQWLEVPHHRSVVHPIQPRRQNFSKGGGAAGQQLFALAPIHSLNMLKWRRLGALLGLHKDLFSDLPWVFSGREAWLSSFRNLVASNRGWKIPEVSLRRLFAWESERVVPQNWIVFSSIWNADRVRDTFRDFGFEIVLVGEALEDQDLFVVTTQDGSKRELPWTEILPMGDEDALRDATSSFAWVMPDIKTPTYGFEKVSIFPDQYLLRLTNPGPRGGLARRIHFDWRSSTRAREVAMRAPISQPLKALKWSERGAQHCMVDAIADGWAAASVDPKQASVWALESCYRQLVARGVDPRSTIKTSFLLNRPSASGPEEKMALNFGAYALATEGFLETMESLDNLELGEVNVERSASALKDYECEPIVHMRGPIEANIQPVLPGFRMTGEALYAVGPRPAFMDVGSRILQHVRVVSNHVTRLVWQQQLELYDLIYRCIKDQLITDLRPISWGGISETLLEMGLWSGIGVQLKPSLSIFELFSGAPGRFLVGILPQEAKRFEGIIKSEWLTPVGTTGGEKLFGLPLERYREERNQKG